MRHPDDPDPVAPVALRSRRGEHRRATRRPGGCDSLCDRRCRSHHPRERDLPNEGGTHGRRYPRGGTGQGGRHGQVAGRVVHSDAAGNGAEQLRSAHRDAHDSVEDGRHELEPAKIQPGRVTTGSAVDGADQRLHLDRQRPAARPG